MTLNIEFIENMVVDTAKTLISQDIVEDIGLHVTLYIYYLFLSWCKIAYLLKTSRQNSN